MRTVTQPAPWEEKVVDQDNTDTAEKSTKPSERPRGGGGPRFPLGGRLLGAKAWLVPLALLVVAAVLAFVNLRHDATADDATEARKVVVTHVEELLSYDYREITDDLAREKDWLTGSFAGEYESLVTDKIAPAAKKSEVVTDAKVSASGVVTARYHEVELLLFANVTTRSSELADAKTAGSRLRVKASWVDGAWRISSLQPV